MRGDINLLFRKFASDFAEQYNTTAIQLSDEALKYLKILIIGPETLGS